MCWGAASVCRDGWGRTALIVSGKSLCYDKKFKKKVNDKKLKKKSRYIVRSTFIYGVKIIYLDSVNIYSECQPFFKLQNYFFIYKKKNFR